MLYGILNLSFLGYVIAIFILTQITIASVTIYLHRHQSHRSLDLHPLVAHFFRFWLWLTTGMVTKEWVAIHRKHHAYTETPDDPHSPQVYGLKHILLYGTELYRKEAKNKDTLERFGKHTPHDWIEQRVYTRYPWLGVTLMFIFDVILFGLPGITIWGIQMLWIPFFGAGFINGVGHYFGYRNHECPDQARNIVPWGLFIGGEELHNNHHSFPNSAKLSVKWWELDIGWFYIRILQKLRLAKIYKTAPKLKSLPDKSSIDLDTVGAVINHRLQILARYSKTVLVPLFKEEKKRAHIAGIKMYRKAKKLLTREISLIDEQNKKILAGLLEKSDKLKIAYQLQEKLYVLWNKAHTNQKELLEALQEWCKQAETTGIEVLHQFVAKLKTYIPAAV